LRTVIEVQDLVRVYRTGQGLFGGGRREVAALDGISFQAGRGEVFGLLGPNGAGKTTTVRILSTLLAPSGGRAEVLGLEVGRRDRELRRRIGVLFGGERGLYFRLSGRENLLYFAILYGMSLKSARRRVAELLEQVGLSGAQTAPVSTYSRGMKQRLHVARVLLHNPEVIMLDEPTIGLDPVAARELRAAVRALARAGRTILLTTHYMMEAQELSDRVAIIDHGRIVAEGPPRSLIEASPDLAVVEVEGLGIPAEAIDELRAQPWIDSLTLDEREHRQLLSIQSPLKPETVVTRLRRMLDEELYARIDIRTPTLEDVYVRLIGDREP